MVDGDMCQLAERSKDEGRWLLFGRSYNDATALEAAPKVKEVALMHRVPSCLFTGCSIPTTLRYTLITRKLFR